MSTRFIVFFAIITAILTLSSFYIGHRIVNKFAWAQSHRAVVWLMLGIFVVLQILGPYLYRADPERFGRFTFLYWISYTALGVFVITLIYTIATDLSLGLWKKIVSSENEVDLDRRGFLASGLMVLGSSVIGIGQAVVKPRIYDVEIPLPNLPPEFDGFKIVQITDLHVGPTIGRKYTETVVEMANALDADLVALTGDFVDGSVSQIGDDLKPIANLKSKHGLFFVTGNHEYYWGVDEWLNEFRKFGARILLNEHAVINQDGKELVIAGVTDYSAGSMIPSHKSDPAKSLKGAPQDAIKILLAHQPANYKQASAAGYDLQLSGHTHGGQFFPWSLIVAMSHRYYKGLNQHEKMWIYVSRGTGYWGPPLRFAVPSEISLIRLKRA
jgi:predicted MPP superfamily phosphohydrolase